MIHPKVAEIVSKDPRFPYEAYGFVLSALVHTQEMRGKDPSPPAEDAGSLNHDVTGQQLLMGMRDLALREFGLMARTVFRLWGIERTQDIGDIVFNLIEANVIEPDRMSKNGADSRLDYRDVFDLDEVLTRGFEIQWNEAE
jgi:uncharacterized repeat protein (TIGR04138 family)